MTTDNNSEGGGFFLFVCFCNFLQLVSLHAPHGNQSEAPPSRQLLLVRRMYMQPVIVFDSAEKPGYWMFAVWHPESEVSFRFSPPVVFLFLWLTELLLCTRRIIPHLHFKLEIKRPAVQALFSWTGLDAINAAFPSFPIIKTLDTYKSTFPGIVAQLRSESYMWTDDEVESYSGFFLSTKKFRKCKKMHLVLSVNVQPCDTSGTSRHCILFIWCCFGRDKCCTPKWLSNNKNNNKATLLEIFYHGFLFSVDERPNLTGKSFLAFPHATVHVDEALLCVVCCVSADQKK